jgi:menaquinone-9 beta-reductase
LVSLGLDFETLAVKNIEKLSLTAADGFVLNSNLDLGGFGVSRYSLDQRLATLATNLGVHVLCQTEVDNLVFEQNRFVISSTKNLVFTATYALGAYGKRSLLDNRLGRDFLSKKSPYLAVKYHIRLNAPVNSITLHNFQQGYCGISAIEGSLYCLCYLVKRDMLRQQGSIAALEKNILSKNPHLKKIFETATFIYDKPLVINEISFENKTAVENHILMIGDTAGLITPLNGNGMAMAIQAANMVATLLIDGINNKKPRQEIEQEYAKTWKSMFDGQLRRGRILQNLFGHTVVSGIVLRLLWLFKPVLRYIVKSTHGKSMLPYIPLG